MKDQKSKIDMKFTALKPLWPLWPLNPFYPFKILFMQLFVTDFKIKWSEVFIENKEILDQIRKVLRLKIWDRIFIQDLSCQKRHEIEIINRDDEIITWKIVQTLICKSKEEWLRWMIVCMPNKWDKIELITQKLTEIWMNEIIFWPSERSVIKEWNQKKEERLNKITKEAVEQSRWRTIPNIVFTTDIKKYLNNVEVIVFDKEATSCKPQAKSHKSDKLCWLVWPEWWLTTKDYGNLEWIDYKVQNLWENVLRTETAAIVGGRVIKNYELWALPTGRQVMS